LLLEGILDDGVAVIALVGEDGLGGDVLEQRVGVRAVVDVAGR